MQISKHYHHLWCEKYRPKSIEDIVLSPEIREHFTSLKEDTPHLLLWGPPGGGKSTLAKIIVNSLLKCQYLYINFSDENGVDTVRNKIINFAQVRSIDGKQKIVILEEADGATGDALRILRNVMEEYADTTRFILTANYLNRIIEPIRSRCLMFKLQPEIKDVVKRCVYILQQEKITVEDLQKPLLLSHIEKNYPDMRRIINDLQKFCISGCLMIQEQNSFTEIVNYIYESLNKKVSCLEIRKKIIENEKTFNADYQQLLKELFEVFYISNQKELIKKRSLLEIGEYMFRDNTVLDHEINFFMCIASLESVLES